MKAIIEATHGRGTVTVSALKTTVAPPPIRLTIKVGNGLADECEVNLGSAEARMLAAVLLEAAEHCKAWDPKI